MKKLKEITEKEIIELPKRVLIDIACSRLQCLKELGYVVVHSPVIKG